MMKIVKALSALCFFSFIFLNSNSQVHSVSKAMIIDSSQNKIDWSAKQFLFFSYFTGQESGAYLTLNTDGLHWQPLNARQTVIMPKVGSQKLMRDPSINYGKDGVYGMVWTTGWGGKDIGYAESLDLLHWGPQKAIPVEHGEKNPDLLSHQQAMKGLLL